MGCHGSGGERKRRARGSTAAGQNCAVPYTAGGGVAAATTRGAVARRGRSTTTDIEDAWGGTADNWRGGVSGNVEVHKLARYRRMVPQLQLRESWPAGATERGAGGSEREGDRKLAAVACDTPGRSRLVGDAGDVEELTPPGSAEQDADGTLGSPDGVVSVRCAGMRSSSTTRPHAIAGAADLCSLGSAAAAGAAGERALERRPARRRLFEGRNEAAVVGEGSAQGTAVSIMEALEELQAVLKELAGGADRVSRAAEVEPRRSLVRTLAAAAERCRRQCSVFQSAGNMLDDIGMSESAAALWRAADAAGAVESVNDVVLTMLASGSVPVQPLEAAASAQEATNDRYRRACEGLAEAVEAVMLRLFASVTVVQREPAAAEACSSGEEDGGAIPQWLVEADLELRRADGSGEEETRRAATRVQTAARRWLARVEVRQAREAAAERALAARKAAARARLDAREAEERARRAEARRRKAAAGAMAATGRRWQLRGAWLELVAAQGLAVRAERERATEEQRATERLQAAVRRLLARRSAQRRRDEAAERALAARRARAASLAAKRAQRALVAQRKQGIRRMLAAGMRWRLRCAWAVLTAARHERLSEMEAVEERLRRMERGLQLRARSVVHAGLRRWAAVWRAERERRRVDTELAARRAAAVTIAIALRQWVLRRQLRRERAFLTQLAVDAAYAREWQASDDAHARGVAAVHRHGAAARAWRQLELDLREQGLRLTHGPGKGGRQRRRRSERRRQRLASGDGE